MEKIFKWISSIAVVALLAVIAFKPISSLENNLGSVSQSSEYHATTTGYVATPNQVLQATPGTFGSVVISGANTGNLFFYDATTTNINLRTGQAATNSLYIGSIPANAAAGTYTFDEVVYNGLVMVISGNPPTSTITYR